MRGPLLSAVIVGMAWAIPAGAFPLATPGVDNVERTLLTKVGWRRQYWRHGYAAPYIYPPAYGYYAPAYPYAYYPPARGYYAPVPNGGYPLADGDYADYPPRGRRLSGSRGRVRRRSTSRWLLKENDSNLRRASSASGTRRTCLPSPVMSAGEDRTHRRRASISASDPKRTWIPIDLAQGIGSKRSLWPVLGLADAISPSPPTLAALAERRSLRPGSLWMRSADTLHVPRSAFGLPGEYFQ